jgi:hypothetical protein
MKNFKMIKFLMVFVVASFLMASSCQPQATADSKQAAQTMQALNNAAAEIGMPAIHRYTELKQFKQILELRDQANLITHTYLMNEMTGEIGQYLGKSIGYGIPAATQFTNPVRTVRVLGNGGGAVQLPQADPNGLFMPTSTSATWVILIGPDGKPNPCFIEPLILVFPFKMH